MSYIKRTLLGSSLIALAMLLVPVSVSPAGSVELAGLCADEDCKRQVGSICFVGDFEIPGYVNIGQRD